MPDVGGYSYDPDVLRSVAETLRSGANALDDAAGAPLEPADAGDSSEVVGQTITELLRAAVGGAQTLNRTAANVHATDGSYAEIENSTAGQFQQLPNAGTY